MPVWFIPSIVSGAVGWVASDVADFAGNKQNKALWVLVGVGVAYYALKKK